MELNCHGIGHHYFASSGMARHNNFHINLRLEKLSTRTSGLGGVKYLSVSVILQVGGCGCSRVAAHVRVLQRLPA